MGGSLRESGFGGQFIRNQAVIPASALDSQSACDTLGWRFNHGILLQVTAGIVIN